MCFKGAPENFVGLDAVFPTAALRFAGNATLSLPPYRYLFMVGRGAYCLGVFDNGDSGALIGGIAVRNVLVTVRVLCCAALCVLCVLCVLWLARVVVASRARVSNTPSPPRTNKKHARTHTANTRDARTHTRTPPTQPTTVRHRRRPHRLCRRRLPQPRVSSRHASRG